MKTINVNLIGDLGKTSKINIKKARKNNSSEAKNQLFAYIFLICILIIFTSSLGGWLVIRKMTSSVDKKIVKLNSNLTALREQETKLSEFQTNLKKEKEIIELKLVIQKQLNSSFFPWSNVLKEIAYKIPKNVIVTKIEKTQGTDVIERSDTLLLKISGITSDNKELQPLTSISLFIFNLNKNENSLLTNAKISKLEFNDKTKAYEFEVETLVKIPKKEEQNSN